MNAELFSNLMGVGAMAAFVLLAASMVGRLRQRGRVRRRLETVLNILDAGDLPVANEPKRGGQQSNRRRYYFEALDRRYPLSGWAKTSGIALGAALATVACVFPALTFFGMSMLIGGPLALLLGVGTGWTVGNFIEQRYREQFQRVFLVAIEDFARMVRFGVMASRAFDAVASSAPDPVGPVLRKIALEVSLGATLGPSLGREARRIKVSEMAMLSAVISIQSRVGGRLAESVGNLTQLLRERLDDRHRLRAATSEPKISLLILCAVPFAGVGLQAATQPQIIETLLGSARHLLGVGVGMILAGMVVSFFIVRSASR